MAVRRYGGMAVWRSVGMAERLQIGDCRSPIRLQLYDGTFLAFQGESRSAERGLLARELGSGSALQHIHGCHAVNLPVTKAATV